MEVLEKSSPVWQARSWLRTKIRRLFLVLSAFPETDKTCKMNFSKSNQAN